MTKYIFVTGGVVSGLGKGITAASLGRLLKSRGYKVALQKFDPYINVDPGTMSPFQHGEVFVTNDGAETDLDVGHYERFVDENLSINSNITQGKIYQNVLKKERNGDYDGNTVQVIPHITNEIKDRVYRMSKQQDLDFVITEIGGTVGDIESHPFLEAIRQVPFDVGRQNVLYVHVTLVPFIKMSGEQKTKPTQHSVKELQNIGIQPDILVCRSEQPIAKESREKLALFCNVSKEAVIQNLDAANLYEIPLLLEKENIAKVALEKLGCEDRPADLTEWKSLVDRVKLITESKKYVKIALVGKYVEMRDAYLSVAESLKHGGIENDVNINIDWVDSEAITEENVATTLSETDGIIIPGGFGVRGVNGMIIAANYARVNKIPFFGICLGMQVACIEYARNVLKYKDADSTEFNSLSLHPIIDILPEKKDLQDLGGTLRLGDCPCVLDGASKAKEAYNLDLICERHRHRYEFNNKFKSALSEAGLNFVGVSPDGKLVEIVEVADHPWYVGVQFHPEFKSRPNRAHPLFRDFIKASKR